MNQRTLNLFKWVDKFLGTPLCYLFGLANRFLPRPALNPQEIKNILVIKWIGLGDVILTLPAVQAIRKRHPDAKITYFTLPRSQMPLRGMPTVDEIISYDITGKDKGIRGLIQVVQCLRRGRFNVAVDLEQRYRLPLLMAFWAGIPHRVGFGVSGQGREWLLTKTTPYIWTMHETEVFGKVSELIDAPIIEGSLPHLEFPTDLKSHELVDHIFQQAAGQRIVLHIGTGPALKGRQWPVDKFVQLIDGISKQHQSNIILTGTKEDGALSEQITGQSIYKIFNMVGKTTLEQLYGLFEKTDLVVSMDTGPMHLAAASGTPTLGIFLASYPEKWRPYGPRHRYIYHGPNIDPKHPRQHPLKSQVGEIEVEEVLHLISIVLQNKI